MTATVFRIARCPEHGLHGQRDECFVCGGPVEQVELASAVALKEALLALQRLASLESFTVALDPRHAKPEALWAELHARGLYALEQLAKVRATRDGAA